MICNPPSYSLRSDSGLLVARLSAAAAREIVLRCDGKWRPYKSGPVTSRAFFIKADMVYLLGSRDKYEEPIGRLFLWSGYKLIEDVAD